MAGFEFSLDMNSIFPQGLDDENLALDMVKAGQEVMLKAIQAKTIKHRVTGNMYKSLKATKPLIDKKSDAESF